MTIASSYSGSCFLHPWQRPSSQLGWSWPDLLPASPSPPSASGSAARQYLSSPHLSSTLNPLLHLYFRNNLCFSSHLSFYTTLLSLHLLQQLAFANMLLVGMQYFSRNKVLFIGGSLQSNQSETTYKGNINWFQHFSLQRNVLSMIQRVGENRHDLMGCLLCLYSWSWALFFRGEQQKRAENGLKVDDRSWVGGIRLH